MTVESDNAITMATHLVDWLKDLTQVFNQWEAIAKPIETFSSRFEQVAGNW